MPPGQVGLQEGEQGQEDEDTQADGENLAGQVMEEGDCRCTWWGVSPSLQALLVSSRVVVEEEEEKSTEDELEDVERLLEEL